LHPPYHAFPCFLSFSVLPPPPTSPLFPYTTLFRSDMPIEVECATVDEVDEALDAGADRLLLDNMTPDRLREAAARVGGRAELEADRKSTRLNSSLLGISYAVFCLKKKKKQEQASTW